MFIISCPPPGFRFFGYASHEKQRRARHQGKQVFEIRSGQCRHLCASLAIYNQVHRLATCLIAYVPVINASNIQTRQRSVDAVVVWSLGCGPAVTTFSPVRSRTTLPTENHPCLSFNPPCPTRGIEPRAPAFLVTRHILQAPCHSSLAQSTCGWLGPGSNWCPLAGWISYCDELPS